MGFWVWIHLFFVHSGAPAKASHKQRSRDNKQAFSNNLANIHPSCVKKPGKNKTVANKKKT